MAQISRNWNRAKLIYLVLLNICQKELSFTSFYLKYVLSLSSLSLSLYLHNDNICQEYQNITWNTMSLDLSSWSPQQSSLSFFSRTRDDPSISPSPVPSSQTQSPHRFPGVLGFHQIILKSALLLTNMVKLKS